MSSPSSNPTIVQSTLSIMHVNILGLKIDARLLEQDVCSAIKSRSGLTPSLNCWINVNNSVVVSQLKNYKKKFFCSFNSCVNFKLLMSYWSHAFSAICTAISNDIMYSVITSPLKKQAIFKKMHVRKWIVHMSVMGFFLMKSNTRVENWVYCITAASHAHLFNIQRTVLYVWCMEHVKKQQTPNNVSVSYRTLVLGVQF